MGVGGVAVLTFALDVDGWLMLRTGCFMPGKEPIWMHMEKEKSLSPTRIELWTIQCIVNCYTDYHGP